MGAQSRFDLTFIRVKKSYLLILNMTKQMEILVFILCHTKDKKK